MPWHHPTRQPRPTPPIAAIRARTAAGWLRIIAAKYGQPVAVMARQLGTARSLADEVAILLNDHAIHEAQRLLAQKAAPPDGPSLLDSLTRGHYAEIKAVEDATRKAAQAAEWDRLYAAQQQRQTAKKETT